MRGGGGAPPPRSGRVSASVLDGAWCAEVLCRGVVFVERRHEASRRGIPAGYRRFVDAAVYAIDARRLVVSGWSLLVFVVLVLRIIDEKEKML